MMKTAFLFPGQGSQFIGMGKDVAEGFPAAKAIFDKANQTLGFDITKICFEGPVETLNTTTISQPAIFTVSAAILEIFRTGEKTKNIIPDITAGLSMGEYTALYAAGLISFEDGLKLVKKRGEAMQAAADKSKGGMVAIIGLDEEKTRALCVEAAKGELLEGVNFNCPGQIAISGAIPACERATGLAEKYGAFHTSMMSPAADVLSQALGMTNIKEPAQPRVIANITADYYTSANQIRQSLAKQLVQPIYWQKCVERLIADGVETFYEIGPGKVLTGLMKRIHRRANIINVSSAAAINEL
jgi:[acyl-carrier-protein] S-malonyltransferase